jgi:hypothetical protein
MILGLRSSRENIGPCTLERVNVEVATQRRCWSSQYASGLLVNQCSLLEKVKRLLQIEDYLTDRPWSLAVFSLVNAPKQEEMLHSVLDC